jgi:nitrate reductase alpha subunit
MDLRRCRVSRIMTRYVICLCMLTIPASAKELTAQQVLDKVASTYANLKAVHMVAEREETTYPAGRAQTTSSEYELASTPDNRYFARLKQSHQQALTVSDGTTIWLALDSKKQWSRMPADSSADDSDEEHDAKVASKNLHDSLEEIMLHRFLALARTVQDPVARQTAGFRTGRREDALLSDSRARSADRKSNYGSIGNASSYCSTRRKASRPIPRSKSP